MKEKQSVSLKLGIATFFIPVVFGWAIIFKNKYRLSARVITAFWVFVGFASLLSAFLPK